MWPQRASPQRHLSALWLTKPAPSTATVAPTTAEPIVGAKAEMANEPKRPQPSVDGAPGRLGPPRGGVEPSRYCSPLSVTRTPETSGTGSISSQLSLLPSYSPTAATAAGARQSSASPCAPRSCVASTRIQLPVVPFNEPLTAWASPDEASE